VDGKPLSEEEVLALPQKIKEKLQEKHDHLEAELRNTMRQLIDMERKIHEALKKLNREVALYAIGTQIETMLENYKDTFEVTAYLKEVQNEILDNLQQFIRSGESQQLPFALPWMKEE